MVEDAIQEGSPLYICPIYSSDAISNVPDETIPWPAIYGRVKRRYLCLDMTSTDWPDRHGNIPLLQLHQGSRVGSLRIDSVTQKNINEIRATSKTINDRLGLHSYVYKLAVELIVLSAGERSYKDGSVFLAYLELYGWYNESAKSNEVYRYYNVMYIRRRKDNVAERMGIGRVVRDLWDEGGDEEIDIELG